MHFIKNMIFCSCAAIDRFQGAMGLDFEKRCEVRLARCGDVHAETGNSQGLHVYVVV